MVRPLAVAYRPTGATRTATAAAAIIAVVAGGFETWQQEWSTRARVILIAVLVVLALALYARSARLATLADASGLTVRTFGRTRSIAWSGVQEIITERQVSSGESQPTEIAVAYLDNGKRLPLYAIDDKNLGSRLPAVVADLRERWQEGRGALWQPDAPVQAKAIARNRYRMASGVVGLLAATYTVAAMVIVVVILHLAHVEASTGTVLGLVVAVPVVVFVAVTVGSVVTRRRASG